MIDEIRVHDVALIREACMTPARGLTVLTGETGAGKTALISACKLLAGERADKTMVREGAAAALVEGRFFLDETALRNAQGDAPDAEDDATSFGEDAADAEVVVARRLGADGRSRVTVNGRMSSVSQLSALIAPSVELCGQHEHQALMRVSAHGALLDSWAADELADLLEAYRAAFAEARRAAAAYERVQEASNASAASLDEARFTLRQIDAVSPEEGEYEELLSYLEKAEHAESLAQAANGAYEGLSGESGALDGIGAAIEALREGARFDESLGAYAASLQEASFVIEDVARDVLSYRDSIEYDAATLAEAQERASAYQGLMRSFGPRLEDVFARRDEARELVSAVDDADERERRAKAALDAAEEALASAAAALHDARLAAAPRFAREVNEVMGKLEMGTAELVIDIGLLPRASWTASGPSSVEFMFRPGAGMQARPLARIASGGEMSRVMLAVHVALGERDGVSTLVFDEVDAGVGGATAVSLARVLAGLARTHQVIAITHLAQVAVEADAHYVVVKSQGEMPETELREVEGVEREAEVARMLSGDATEASLAHAREMLANARESG